MSSSPYASTLEVAAAAEVEYTFSDLDFDWLRRVATRGAEAALEIIRDGYDKLQARPDRYEFEQAVLRRLASLIEHEDE
jgi:hypothetical protein